MLINLHYDEHAMLLDALDADKLLKAHWITRRRQTTLNPPFSCLHLLFRDVFSLGQVGDELGDIRTMAHGHAHADLFS